MRRKPQKKRQVIVMKNPLITPEYGPLHGMRAMLSGSALAGPWAARMLGDYGAEIIKIETPKVGAWWGIPPGWGPGIPPASCPNGTRWTATP